MRHLPSPLERQFGALELGLLKEQWEEAIKDESVDVSLLLQVTTLRDPRLQVSPAKRRLANQYHRRLLLVWKKANPDVRIAALAPLAVILLHPGEHLQISLSPAATPTFDWSEAQALLYRVDLLSERARLWIHDEKERGPHLERAYGLASQVLTAVQRQIWTHDRGEASATETAALASELTVLRAQLDAIEALFRISASESAQARYTVGMVRGAAALAVFTAVLGGLFYGFDVPAYVGVAVPAGGLGAIISALQRMHTGDLQLDFQANAERLRRFGAVRPLIGAVFGMFVVAVILAGQLPALEVPSRSGPQLALFSVIGFLSGFNERFAQDVVSASSKRLQVSAPGSAEKK